MSFGRRVPGVSDGEVRRRSSLRSITEWFEEADHAENCMVCRGDRALARVALADPTVRAAHEALSASEK